MDILHESLSSSQSYDERLKTVGVLVSELRDDDLNEICEGNAAAKISLKSAGGIVVRGTPWNPGYIDEDRNIDTKLRVFYCYDEYRKFGEQLLQKVKDRGKKYDAVLTMPRGGVGIGAQLAQGLGVELGYIHAQSYGHGEKAGRVEIGDFVLPKSLESKLALWNASDKTDKSLQPRVLLSDDMADKGATFLEVKKKLEERGYIVETAAILKKVTSKMEPDYVVFDNYPSAWVVQPGEGWVEGITKRHNVGEIQSDDRIILLNSLLSIFQTHMAGRGANVTELCFVVAPDSYGAHDGLLATLSRIIKGSISYKHTFITEKPTNIGPFQIIGNQGPQLSIWIHEGICYLQLPKISSHSIEATIDQSKSNTAKALGKKAETSQRIQIIIARHIEMLGEKEVFSYEYMEGNDWDNLCHDEPLDNDYDEYIRDADSDSVDYLAISISKDQFEVLNMLRRIGASHYEGMLGMYFNQNYNGTGARGNSLVFRR